MSALISEDGLYRYELRRQIPQPVRWIKRGCFLMLNPSTADAETDDPTIRRCIGFGESFGWTELIVLNLFAFRATDPRDLLSAKDPIGDLNDDTIRCLEPGTQVIAAWGAHKLAQKRAEDVLKILDRPVYALGATKSGAPRHPLYLKNSATPQLWDGYAKGAA